MLPKSLQVVLLHSFNLLESNSDKAAATAASDSMRALPSRFDPPCRRVTVTWDFSSEVRVGLTGS